ncbi:MAG TPA: hypothetical protein PLM56_16615 [Cyclobacteriaceae bacterium]|jgi:hypothetical protein|nr:hypothetical protein [Cytophagales bacterium]HRE68657.1 hypothetical protein [Cyclobacteriaceae bacterium]HRF35131.1 hypothetical protein [Cyclobacteriaceae bacterium]
MKNKNRVILLFLLLSFYSTFSQRPENRKEIVLSESEFKTIGKTPAILKEASGLYIDENGTFWSHNDDRYPILYNFDSAGIVKKVVHLNHTNIGWEGITSDRAGNMYIAGIGNNKNDRKDLAIIKIKPLNAITEKVTQGQLIHFSYSDQTEYPPPSSKKNFDSDALIAWGDTLLIFTKNRTNPNTGYSHIYQLSQQPGNYIAMLIDSVFTGQGSLMENWVTDAALSPDMKMLALLGHDKIWIITDFENRPFSQGKITLLRLPHVTHKAGLAFSGNSSIYVVDEKEFDILGGNIYKLDLNPLNIK